jgi:hypothetical protein
MSELESKTIMVSLVFTNEVVEVNGDDYKGKCKLVQVLLEDNPTVEKIEIKVDFDSEYFRRFIMNNELEQKELNVPFSVNLERGPFVEFINSSDQRVESMFVQLGYFGADNAIILLRNIVKKVIRYKYVDHKSVENFFLKNRLEYVLGNPNISDSYVRKVIRKFDDCHWETVSENSSVSLELMMEYEANIDWPKISKRKGLPIWFVNKYQDRLDWIAVCAFAALDDVFVNQMPENRKNWKSLATNSHLSESFIEANIDNGNINAVSDINYLVWNKGLSENFFLKYVDNLILCTNLSELCSNPNLGADFYTKIIQDHPRVELNWNILCLNSSLPQSFFEQHKQLIGIHVLVLAKHPNVTYPFLESVGQNFLNVDIFKFYLYENPQMDEKKIAKVLSESKEKFIFWSSVIQNTSISEVFISSHSKDIDESTYGDAVWNSFRYHHNINYRSYYLGKYL